MHKLIKVLTKYYFLPVLLLLFGLGVALTSVVSAAAGDNAYAVFWNPWDPDFGLPHRYYNINFDDGFGTDRYNKVLELNVAVDLDGLEHGWLEVRGWDPDAQAWTNVATRNISWQETSSPLSILSFVDADGSETNLTDLSDLTKLKLALFTHRDGQKLFESGSSDFAIYEPGADEIQGLSASCLANGSNYNIYLYYEAGAIDPDVDKINYQLWNASTDQWSTESFEQESFSHVPKALSKWLPDTKSAEGVYKYRFALRDTTGSVLDYSSYVTATCGCPAINADFNGDDMVDGDDYVIWVANNGTSSGASHSDGDADGDGDVDEDDYNLFNDEEGANITGCPSPTPSATPTPTPTPTP